MTPRTRAQPRVMVPLRHAELTALKFALARPGVRSRMGIVLGTRRGATQTPLQLAINRIDAVWSAEEVKRGKGASDEKRPRAEGSRATTPALNLTGVTC